MVINYTTKKTSTVISAVVTALLLIFSVSSFGQTPVAVENSSSLSIASFDSSYVNDGSSDNCGIASQTLFFIEFTFSAQPELQPFIVLSKMRFLTNKSTVKSGIIRFQPTGRNIN